ncbi:MAG: zinc-ribbon domain-containing protein [Clostridia bacterium]|nr:zinc-ribbon domain-containing protein [Clostridia bacterium]
MSDFQTEFDFVLPKGYLDKDGNLHKAGRMRLATAADEILPLKDPWVQANPAYLIIILLSRVITSLGTLSAINTKVIEQLFVPDLSYLQDFYNRINGSGTRVMGVTCPHCQKKFEVEPESSGE